MDAQARTSVPGVYAAGDLAVAPQQIAIALGSGHLAGTVFATRAADEEELHDAPFMELATLAVRAIPAFATAAKVERDAHGVLRFALASAAEAEVQSNPLVELEALVTAALKNGTLDEVLAARGLKVAELQDEAKIQAAVEGFRAELERLSGRGDPADAVPRRAAEGRASREMSRLGPWSYCAVR